MKRNRNQLVRAVRNIEPIAVSDVAAFLLQFRRKRALFFLGAGASVPLLPTVAEQRRIIQEIALNRDLYNAEVANVTPLALQLGLLDGLENMAFAKAFRLVRFSSLSVAVAYDISLASRVVGCAGSCPDQYAVLRLTDPTAAVLTTNNDGLARRCCGRPVVELHGALLDLQVDDDWTVRLPDRFLPMLHTHLLDQLPICEDFDRRLGPVPGIMRPGDRLAPWLLKRFELSWQRLRDAEVLIDVGYSLPAYDEDIRELLCDGFRISGRPIWVLGPAPAPTSDEMGALLGSAAVRPWGVRWDCLAAALVSVARAAGCAHIDGLRHRLHEVCTAYGQHLIAAEVLTHQAMAVAQRSVEDVFTDPNFLAIERAALAVRFGIDPDRFLLRGQD